VPKRSFEPPESGSDLVRDADPARVGAPADPDRGGPLDPGAPTPPRGLPVPGPRSAGAHPLPVHPAPVELPPEGTARPRLPVHAEPVGDRPPGSAAELTDRTVVTRRLDPPRSAWRRLVHRVGAGALGVGDSAAGRIRCDREDRVRRPLAAPHHVAVVSLKGGVGKTTVAACIGLVMSELRGDRVAVLDADPDAGTLADRLSGESTVSLRDLAPHADAVRSLAELDRYTSLSGRLQVLAGDQRPLRDDALDEAEYARAAAAMARFCNVVITDSGPGMLHAAVRATLAVADSLVVVGSPTVDGASRAARTLDWLAAHGRPKAARRSVVVLSGDRAAPEVDVARLREHFAPRCRAVVDLPRDPHLATGGRIRPAALRPATGAAVLELAALVADEFGAPRPDR
jgi:MinD-like ATPase involved in chromosome partitioning or flagellar assembly